MLGFKLEDLYDWYKLNGEPTRDKIREGKVEIPDGISKSLVESLLPYFTSLKDKPLLYIPNEGDRDETSMVITSDWHIPFHDREALKVFINFLSPDLQLVSGVRVV